MYNIMDIGGLLVGIIKDVYNGIKYGYQILMFHWSHHLVCIVGLLCTLVIMHGLFIYVLFDQRPLELETSRNLITHVICLSCTWNCKKRRKQKVLSGTLKFVFAQC